MAGLLVESVDVGRAGRDAIFLGWLLWRRLT